MGEKKTGIQKQNMQTTTKANEMEHIAAGRNRITKTRTRGRGRERERGRGSQRTQLKKIINLYNTVAHRHIHVTYMSACIYPTTGARASGSSQSNEIIQKIRFTFANKVKSQNGIISIQNIQETSRGPLGVYLI